MRSSPNRLLLIRLSEITVYISLTMVCWIVTWFSIREGAFEDYVAIALCVSLIAGIGPLAWQLRSQSANESNLSVLIDMGFRFSIFLGAVAISTATKWQHHNSFCNCLLGYYFPFLLLQSALLIRNQSFQIPPQS